MATEDKEISLDTKTSDVLDQLKEQSPCAEAIDWMEQYKDLSWDECIDSHKIDDQSWAMWLLVKVGKVSNLELRKKLIDRIRDPMMAFSLYLRTDWLTDEEDRLLEAKFKGKLPRAEAELSQGIVKRKKWL